MDIVILADSYGAPRVHNNRWEVNDSQTYPQLINEQLSLTHDVTIDFLSFRKLIDLPELMNVYPKADIFILQAGIVDAYPRVLSKEKTISNSFFNKLLRRVVRLNRAFFIKNISSKPWVSVSEYKHAIETMKNTKGKKIVWVNIAPVNKFQDSNTPGANKSIEVYNAILRSEIQNAPNNYLLDVYSILSGKTDYETYLHPVDSHLNIKGNQLYADLITDILKRII